MYDEPRDDAGLKHRLECVEVEIRNAAKLFDEVKLHIDELLKNSARLLSAAENLRRDVDASQEAHAALREHVESFHPMSANVCPHCHKKAYNLGPNCPNCGKPKGAKP